MKGFLYAFLIGNGAAFKTVHRSFLHLCYLYYFIRLPECFNLYFFQLKKSEDIPFSFK
jgi:hypothetical protein